MAGSLEGPCSLGETDDLRSEAVNGPTDPVGVAIFAEGTGVVDLLKTEGLEAFVKDGNGISASP